MKKILAVFLLLAAATLLRAQKKNEHFHYPIHPAESPVVIDGVAYLDQTALKYRVFTEIWAARTLLLPKDLCPPVADPGYYGLAHA